MLPRDFMDDQKWWEDACALAGLEKVACPGRETLVGLPDDCFGGIFVDEFLHKHARFPLDEADNLQRSALYLLDGQHGLTKSASANVAHHLLEGFFGFNLEPPVELLELSKEADGDRIMSAAEALAPQLPEFVPPREDEYVLKIAGVLRFPVRDVEEAEKAAQYFEDQYTHFPAEIRRTAAAAFQEKLAGFGVDVGEAAQQYLGDTRSWLFKAAMTGRATLRPDFAPLYAALIDDEDPDLEVLAHKLAEVDAASGLEREWDTAIPDPWATVYNNMIKVGEEKFEYRIGGETVTGTDLARVVERKPVMVENYFGQTLSADFIKNPIRTFMKAGPEFKRIIAQLAKEVRIDSR